MHLNTKRKTTLISLVILLFIALIIEISAFSYLLSIGSTDNNSYLSDNFVITDNINIYDDIKIAPTTFTNVSVTPTDCDCNNNSNSIKVTVTQDATITLTNTPSPSPSPSPIAEESSSAYVAFYSDPQSDLDSEDANHQRVVDYILSKGANPVFNAGDILEDGTQNSLDRFNAVTATLRSSRRFYSALGNNDRVEGDYSTPSQIYLDNFSFPNNERWYSVNWGNLHMVILDSAFASTSLTQKDWLQADLQSSESQDRITGVMFHHPSYAPTISSYLISNNADFVIMGHEHSFRYYDSNDIDHFVSTGQTNMGYFTLTVFDSYATLRVYDHNNTFIRSYNINNR